MSKHFSTHARSQLGISFVEVLVAMVIGVIILAGVMQSMLTNQRNTAWSDDVAFVQENARYGLEILARDIRGAGYWGCAVNNSIADDPTDSSDGGVTNFGNALDVAIDHAWLRLEGIQGYEGSVDTLPDEFTGLWQDSADYIGNDDFAPDVVIFRSGDEELDLNVSRHRANSRTDFPRDNPLRPGDIAITVSEDCKDVGLMQVTQGDNDGLFHEDSGTVPGNCTEIIRSNESFNCDSPPSDKLLLGPGSVVTRFDSIGYYIGTSVSDASQPALYRAQFLSVDDSDEVTLQRDEIAVGVEDMQLLYGFDTDADGLANAYVRADAIDADAGEWRQVVSVRVTLLLRGFGDTREDDTEVKYVGYPFAGDDDTYTGQAYNDTILRQQVNKTVHIRNIGAG